jgi:hypothetical protein
MSIMSTDQQFGFVRYGRLLARHKTHGLVPASYPPFHQGRVCLPIKSKEKEKKKKRNEIKEICPT